MKQFDLTIITADQVKFEGKAEGIFVRTTVGDKGILANHEPYTAALPIGQIKVNFSPTEHRYAAISQGVIQTENNKVVLLAQTCEWADEIRLEDAIASKEEAERQLKELKETDEAYLVMEYKLKRALNRIQTVEKTKQ
jgi:F-type H+-transporting ATPase subunit epsilon